MPRFANMTLTDGNTGASPEDNCDFDDLHDSAIAIVPKKFTVNVNKACRYNSVPRSVGYCSLYHRN